MDKLTNMQISELHERSICIEKIRLKLNLKRWSMKMSSREKLIKREIGAMPTGLLRFLTKAIQTGDVHVIEDLERFAKVWSYINTDDGHYFVGKYASNEGKILDH